MPGDGDIDALFRECCTLLRRRDPRAASLLPRLEEHVAYGRGWRALGVTLLRAGQVEAALVAAERAAAADPRDDAAQRLLAEVCSQHGSRLRERGDRAAAERALERAVALDAGHVRAAFALGLLRQDRGDHAGAAASYRAALAARPDSYEAALNLGIVLQEARQFEAAMDAYARCYRLNATSFGRIAQAVTAAPVGRLWLDIERLRAELVARA